MGGVIEVFDGGGDYWTFRIQPFVKLGIAVRLTAYNFLVLAVNDCSQRN